MRKGHNTGTVCSRVSREAEIDLLGALLFLCYTCSKTTSDDRFFCERRGGVCLPRMALCDTVAKRRALLPGKTDFQDLLINSFPVERHDNREWLLQQLHRLKKRNAVELLLLLLLLLLSTNATCSPVASKNAKKKATTLGQEGETHNPHRRR